MNKDIYNPKQKRGCLASIGIFFLTLFVSNIIFQIVFLGLSYCLYIIDWKG